MLPDASPVAEGAKLAVKVALAPGLRATGSATPLIVNPEPEAEIWEIVVGAVPEFVTVKL